MAIGTVTEVQRNSGQPHPPQRSALRTLGLVTLRCYLLAAIAVLAARAVQLTLASG